MLLPPAVRAALGAEIGRLRAVAAADVAWVAPDNLHVTLKFLGRVDAARLDQVQWALADVARAGRAFDLGVRGLGAFPTASRARVLWAGVAEGAQALGALAAAVDARLGGLGLEPETRPFAAHVTLGRVRTPQRDAALAAAVGAGTGRDFGTFAVDAFVLMRSDLSPRGARYSVLASWRLGADPERGQP